MKCLILLCALVVAQCAFTIPADCKPSAKSYRASGVVQKIAADRRHVTIHHKAISGYMMEMTMDFPVKNTNELSGLSPGDEVTFSLVVAENEDWVEKINVVGHTNNTATVRPPATLPELRIGDLLPDHELVAENGRPIRFSNFRGKALAFTFFFTRCPLPDYCPRMNKNFAEARKLLLTTSNAPANWEFLSLSFDADFDQPRVLSNYADLYRDGSADHWLFAAAPTPALADLAPRLDLMIMREAGNISHNLRTVVLDPQGRIYRQFDGNQWTPRELADAVLKAARIPANEPAGPSQTSGSDQRSTNDK